MATQPSASESASANIVAIVDSNVQKVLASEWAVMDQTAPLADERLKRFGGLALLHELMWRPRVPVRYAWRPESTVLDTAVLPDKYGQPTNLVMVALHCARRGGYTRDALLVGLGHRVNGSPYWLIPRDSWDELAYVANAIVARRERLA